MPGKGDATRERIHQAALKEFLEKGFRDASLRTIAKEAGVTTGSFYWYYKSKEELFAALVGPYYEHLLGIYQQTLDVFWQMPREEQKERMGDMGGEGMAQMLEYMHAHREEFLILLRGADGTPYDNLLHELTEREVAATHQFTKNIAAFRIGQGEISPEMEHIVTSGMFQGLFELILHDIPIETARVCVRELHDFYTAGFAYALRMPLPEYMKEQYGSP